MQHHPIPILLLYAPTANPFLFDLSEHSQFTALWILQALNSFQNSSCQVRHCPASWRGQPLAKCLLARDLQSGDCLLTFFPSEIPRVGRKRDRDSWRVLLKASLFKSFDLEELSRLLEGITALKQASRASDRGCVPHLSWGWIMDQWEGSWAAVVSACHHPYWLTE